MKRGPLATLIISFLIPLDSLAQAPPAKGKLSPRPTVGTCKKDSDCVHLPAVCGRCVPCVPQLRFVGSKDRAAAVRSIQARVRCAPKKCRTCANRDNWLPTEAVCKKGVCEAVPPRPAIPRSKERACRRDRDCELRPQSACGCPSCGISWRSAVNRKTAARLRKINARKSCPPTKCGVCRTPENRLVGSGAACRKRQCIVTP